MRNDFFSTSIEFLKGVGPQRAAMLKKELGIQTFGDLLRHYPFRYVDRTRFYTIAELTPDLPYIQVRGMLRAPEVKGVKRKQRMTAMLEDGTGRLELVWFQGLRWVRESLRPGQEYIVFGKPGLFQRQLHVVHPELELAAEAQATVHAALQPVYNTTEKLKARGLDSRGILRLQKALQLQLPPAAEETLPESLVGSLRLSGRTEAFRQIHFPSDAAGLKKAQYRLKLEELFFLQLRLLFQRQWRQGKTKGPVFSEVGDLFNGFYHDHLPFPLTQAQKRVLREIRADCRTGSQMNRLLQGDVGSGKTLVACMSMLLALDNGWQACLMAPTEILAIQHARSFAKLLGDLPVQTELLTGSTRAAGRKKILEGLAAGTVHFLVGTHALIEEAVQFRRLGLVVIDEQHRFGVEQRAALHWKGSGTVAPHILVMTATPIPRTLAMTLYGDLDVSVIDELPPGRKPVSTQHRDDSGRLAVWGFLKKQIAAGRQAYVVYPLIEESAKSDLKSLMDGYESICRDFPRPRYQVSVVHGRMKAADKETEMQRFIRGETQIMVATSVIEVGVDVPNASVMVIENAERFGLSQLHQLRGRVGRGADQSYCILMTGSRLGADARTRIQTMVATTDGFRIAETDLQLRGAGDLQGTQQSGLPDLKIANLSDDQAILSQARSLASAILEKDPGLSLPDHASLRGFIDDWMRSHADWSRVS